MFYCLIVQNEFAAWKASYEAFYTKYANIFDIRGFKLIILLLCNNIESSRIAIYIH